MNEEEKKAVQDSKNIINELNNHKDKDFIGRMYYKNKPIEEILKILLNLIEKLQNENKELKEIVEEAIATCFSEYNDDTEILCRKLARYGYIGFDEKRREYINPLIKDDRDMLEKKKGQSD